MKASSKTAAFDQAFNLVGTDIVHIPGVYIPCSDTNARIIVLNDQETVLFVRGHQIEKAGQGWFTATTRFRKDASPVTLTFEND